MSAEISCYEAETLWKIVATSTTLKEVLSQTDLDSVEVRDQSPGTC